MLIEECRELGGGKLGMAVSLLLNGKGTFRGALLDATLQTVARPAARKTSWSTGVAGP